MLFCNFYTPLTSLGVVVLVNKKSSGNNWPCFKKGYSPVSRRCSAGRLRTRSLSLGIKEESTAVRGVMCFGEGRGNARFGGGRVELLGHVTGFLVLDFFPIFFF